MDYQRCRSGAFRIGLKALVLDFGGPLEIVLDTVNMPVAPTFTTAFSVNGNVVPEPVSTVRIIIELGYIVYRRCRI
jgi:hypothetical protein